MKNLKIDSVWLIIIVDWLIIVLHIRKIVVKKLIYHIEAKKILIRLTMKKAFNNKKYG